MFDGLAPLKATTIETLYPRGFIKYQGKLFLASDTFPVSRASKKIILPDPSVRSVMIKYLEKTGEINFDKIFNQRLGYLLFKDFCLNVVNEQVVILVLLDLLFSFYKLNVVVLSDEMNYMNFCLF